MEDLLKLTNFVKFAKRPLGFSRNVRKKFPDVHAVLFRLFRQSVDSAHRAFFRSAAITLSAAYLYGKPKLLSGSIFTPFLVLNCGVFEHWSHRWRRRCDTAARGVRELRLVVVRGGDFAHLSTLLSLFFVKRAHRSSVLTLLCTLPV
jgi:hypothetical protein